MSALANQVFRTLGPAYRKLVGSSLSTYGLHYEDCLINNASLDESLTYLPSSVDVARTRRQKRAMDLSFKRKSYTDYKSADTLEPFKFEIIDMQERIERREEERELVNKGW